jgi:hypothetical protein
MPKVSKERLPNPEVFQWLQMNLPSFAGEPGLRLIQNTARKVTKGSVFNTD